MAKLIDLDGLAYFYGKIKAMLAEKLGKNDTAPNAAKVNGLTVETAVPKNAKFTDTVYTHPATHPASMITGLAAVATSGSYNDLSNRPAIPTKVSDLQNDAGYLTQHQSLDGYVKSSELKAVAKSGSYNDLSDKPTIPIVPSNVSAFTNDAGYLTQHQSLDGYAKTSDANTWTAEQNLNNVNITLERYAASSVSGTSATPTASTAVYTATGNFTLDFNSIAGNLANGQTTVFTARINATADYTLSINIDGAISYIGKASDVAITSAGLLLNVFISRLDNSTTCIVQASKLS